jgi:hypothetical protein
MNDPALAKDTRSSTSVTAVPMHAAGTKSQKTDADSDGDGIPDAVELGIGLNPTLSDTDGDGIPDGKEGVKTDTDNDGIIDALESSLDDSDLDGVPDQFDAQNTNPDNDSDGDGYNNGLENAEGSNPMDAKSIPADRDKDGIPDNIDADGGPISFSIVKNGGSVAMEGSLRDLLQVSSLQEAFDQNNISYQNGVIMKDSSLGDKQGAISLAKKIAPLFLSYYIHGIIRYSDDTFEISGEVSTGDQKDKIDKVLMDNAGLIHYVNDTRVADISPKTNLPSDETLPGHVAQPNHNESNKTGESK